MKLEQNQLDVIENYLNWKELVQVDLKNEVLDHMANSIEDRMEEDGVSFSMAFKDVVLVWEKELSNNSSPLIGLLFSGPKMLIYKCVKELKQIYYRTAVIAFLITILFTVLSRKFDITLFLEFSRNLFGYTYFLAIGIIVILHFAIRRTKTKSSFSYLFKTQAVGFGFFYIIHNPLLTDMFGVFKSGEYDFVAFLAYSIMLVFSFSFFPLYKAHLKVFNTINA
tara:strand:+ start:424 stop:1092 length:669 start_codon:yes stop_codon:yes gene_type:complete